MKRHKIKDLMVPRSEYAVISQDASIYEAVLSLEKAQQAFDQSRYHHRAILVEDKHHKIVGKLGQLDVLRAMEPKYEEMKSDAPGMMRYGFSKRFLLSLLETYELFNKPMDDICKKAGHEKVSKYMHRPTEGEYIEEDESLDKAIHLLIIGHHQSLLVTRKDEIVGLLRLTDVFAAVFHAMKECGL
ncbi:MAG: CBS domain-containing protein [Desulfobacteraceae bacterium]|nr:MAG: CBS domain-containing protein [Desulfobacteraceae bacterium]